MQENCCDRAMECLFYQIIQEAEQVQDVMKKYVQAYCYGPLRDKCKRLAN